MNLTIRPLQSGDIQPIAAAFAAIGWNKPASQYEGYLAQQVAVERVVLVAFLDWQFVGYVTIVWLPDYPFFRDANIPEVQDFNVLPEFQRRGIGRRLMDEAEARVGERSSVVGIGVGMTADYGSAQRMYVKRGYIPDGRGLAYRDQIAHHGQQVALDDDLVLHFTKELTASR